MQNLWLCPGGRQLEKTGKCQEVNLTSLWIFSSSLKNAKKLNFLHPILPNFILPNCPTSHLHRHGGGRERRGFGSRCQGLPRGQVPDGIVPEGGHQRNLQVSDRLAPKPFVVSISRNVSLRKVGQISLDPYAVFVYLMFHTSIGHLCATTASSSSQRTAWEGGT